MAKNKFLIYSLCLEKILDMIKSKNGNEEVDHIADHIYDNLKNEFIKLLSLFQEMIDSDQQTQIQTLQLENDELKTELEIAYRELHLLRKKTRREANGNQNDYNNKSPRKKNACGDASRSPRPTNGDYAAANPTKDDHIGAINPRVLSLKHLKDMTNDILKNKES